jgi:hypothetical protein
MHLFPDQPVSRNYKTKEQAVVDHVKKHHTEHDWTADRTIAGGCSRRRPDMFLDLGSHVLIVEVDENMHERYDCSCENKRLMELSQDVAHRPLIFVRFNPDKYIDQDGSNVSSCWSTGKDGITRIGRGQKKKWETRLTRLAEQIDYWVANVPEKMVEVVQLFYDQNLDPPTPSAPAPQCGSTT